MEIEYTSIKLGTLLLISNLLGYISGVYILWGAFSYLVLANTCLPAIPSFAHKKWIYGKSRQVAKTVN